MNQELNTLLTKVAELMNDGRSDIFTSNQSFDDSTCCCNETPSDSVALPGKNSFWNKPQNQVHVGVDLGTAYTVLIVLDEHMHPLIGEYRFAQFVRDGLVVDSQKAINLLRELKYNAETRLGFKLNSAATAYPPGVSLTEIKAKQYVVQNAGFECDQSINEPTAANLLLQIKDGAIADVGGGTTGIAVIHDGNVVYTADEPTGGTHLSLVIAGALNMEFEEAEALKKDQQHHNRIYPIVYPVMEKIGTIIAHHLTGQHVDTIYLVGGTSCFTGIDKVVQNITGITTIVPIHPLFVTPLGVAMFNTHL